MNLAQESISLLKELISIPSYSKEEDKTADLIQQFLQSKDYDPERTGNNIWLRCTAFVESRPTVLLNSHHDTVKLNKGYTRDPFLAEEVDDKLYGLGSNDAGGCLVSLLATFLHFEEADELPFNLVFAASAEEEISGKNGIASIIEELPRIDLAIVGEPTLLNLAIAEKGLMVLDCLAKGKAGHAARNEGVNAIYEALGDIKWFEIFQFPEESDALGPVKMTVSQIEAGQQHNVVPAECRFVVDVRTTDAYTNQETLEIIQSKVRSEVKARSTRLNPSGIASGHPILKAAEKLGLKTYGSPALSDQALMPFYSVKFGPGDSARSHMADEYIYLNEIEKGIEAYIDLLKNLKF